MQKKNDQSIKIYAQDYLKAFRKNNQSSGQSIKQNKQIPNNSGMDIEMASQSQLQAQGLFGNLNPQSQSQQESEKVMRQQKKQKKQKKQRKQKKIVKEQKPRNRMVSEEDVHKQQMNKMKSILLKGRVYAEKQSQSDEEKKQVNTKRVTFTGPLIPLNSDVERKWKDPIENQKKGKFDQQQERILSEAVGKFLATNDISLDQFGNVLTCNEKSQKFSRKQKIFSLLATVLPNRSTQSCYKYLKRNFNSLNRKGKWSQQQIEQLKILVQRYGRKWSMISKQLKRSPDNVYDKYRQLGDQNMAERVKGIWKLRQLIQLLKLIQKMTKIKFIDYKVDSQLQREDYHDMKERQEVSNRKYNSKNFIFHNIVILKPYINSKNFQKIDISLVKWNQVSMSLKTRTTLDCRNKIIQLLQIFFHTSGVGLDEYIIEFLIKKRYHSQHQINWKLMKNSQEAKNRFMIMKKMIQGRSVKQFRVIVNELKYRFDRKNEQSQKKSTKSSKKSKQ